MLVRGTNLLNHDHLKYVLMFRKKKNHVLIFRTKGVQFQIQEAESYLIVVLVRR